MKSVYTLVFIFIMIYSIHEVNSQRNKTVIIIGAGMSGLSAAKEFVDNGFTNFMILEAENRIGGRINTINYSNS